MDCGWPDHVQGWRILQLDHRAHGRSPTGLVPGHHWKKMVDTAIRQFEIPPKGSFNAENDEQLLVQGTKWIPNLRQPQIQPWSVNCETAVVLPLLSKALGQGASDLGSSPHNLESCAEDVLETLLGFFFQKMLVTARCMLVLATFGHHQVPFWLWSKPAACTRDSTRLVHAGVPDSAELVVCGHSFGGKVALVMGSSGLQMPRLVYSKI